MTERFGIVEALRFNEPVVRVVVASVDGSTPREAGAAMFVTQAPSPGAVAPPSPARGEGRRVGSSRLARPLPAREPLRRTASIRLRERAECASIPGEGAYGTIGGGQLEFEAIAHARAMLETAKVDAAPWQRDMRVWPLGPSLGQCCGGSVRILFEMYTDQERASMADIESASLIIRPTNTGEPLQFLSARQEVGDLPLHVARVAKETLSGARNRKATFLPARKGQSAWFIEPVRSAAKPLYIYGAGHVGRAIVRTLADLPFNVHWVDVSANRFPSQIPDGVRQIIASDPVTIAGAAPKGAYHLVLTYSHALDLAICHALLANPIFDFCGLIGSASKRARFIKRLREGGVMQAAIDRLTCPIGIGNLRGKEPATIAISVAAQLIERLEKERETGIDHEEGARDGDARISA